MWVTQRVARAEPVPLRPTLIIEDDEFTVGNEVLRYGPYLKTFRKLLAHVASAA